MTNHPECQYEANRASSHRDDICRAVALETFDAGALATGSNDAVLVENDAVEQIENVAGKDGRHGHETPILG